MPLRRTLGASNTPSCNTAGSGAYRVTSWKPGVEIVYERNDDWVGGKLPKLKKVIWRTIPAAGNRRALMERGDADISFDLPPKDFSEMKKETKLKLISIRSATASTAST